MPDQRSLASLVLIALLVAGPLMAQLPWQQGPGEAASSGHGPVSLAPRDERAAFSVTVPADPAQLASHSGLFYTGSAMETASGGSGHLVSHPISLSEGKRWDHARALVTLPRGSASIEVWDATSSTYPGATRLAQWAVWGPASSVAVDLLDEDHVNVTQVQVVVRLDHTGQTGAPPSVSSLAVAQCDVDYWHDPFWELDREADRADLFLGMGWAAPNRTHIPGGLLGRYYNNRDFTNFAFERLDRTIDYDWGNGPPGGGMGANTFSVRWQGKLMVPRDGNYTMYLRVDDGGRLWIDGQLIIDEWRDQSPTEFSAQRQLDEGLHDIRIDYYDNQGGASVELRWAGPGISKRVIPSTALWGRKSTNVLVSEDIALPEGQVWDLLLMDTLPRSVPLVIDLIDSGTGQPVYGYTDLPPVDRDISGLSAGTYPSLRLRARWAEGEPSEASQLLDWGIKWMPERTWRCEFLTDLKVVGTVSLQPGDGKVTLSAAHEQTTMFAFAEAFDGISTGIESTVYKGDYWSTDLPTQNASDVAIADLDGDGFDDVLFTSGDPGVNATAFRGGAGGFPSAPTWTFGHDPSSGGRAYFKEVVLADLDQDGRVDVVMVEADHARPRADKLLIYLNHADGWNATPDEVIDEPSGSISGVGIGNINGSGPLDMVIGYSSGDIGLRLVYDYGSGQWTDDWYGGWIISAVHVGDVDGDGFDDACIGGGYNQAYNLLHRGMSLGLHQTSTSLGGQNATAITFADWNGDGRSDVVLVEGVGVTIRLQDASGGFPDYRTFTVPDAVDVATIRASGDGDEDLAVACDSLGPTDGSRYMEAIGSTGLFQRIYSTDTAVAAAAGSADAEFLGSLRTIVIDVGDADRAGHWTDLSFRPPEGGGWFATGQSVRFAMRDASDDELLWEKTWSHGQGAGQGTSAAIDPPVSAREHPRVYLEVFMENEGDTAMDLGHIEVAWDLRVPTRPSVSSLSADARVIYRTNSTTLRIVATDDYDPPANLTLTVQMKPPTGGGYITDRLDDPVWDGTNWTVRFYTTRDDPAGVYSFRVTALDSDMLDSGWFEEVDLVSVINNPPGVPVIGVTPEEPLTSDDVVCRILRQAPDIDTASLDYEYEWYVVPIDDVVTTTSVVPSNLTVKGQLWQVRVRAFDGDDHGPWVTARVLVLNSPPSLVSPLDRIDMREDEEPMTLRLRDRFFDPDGDDLTFTAGSDGPIGLELEDLTQRLTISLPPDWHGAVNVTINASDGEAWTLVVTRLIVASVNDEPVVVSVGGKAPGQDGVFEVEAWEDQESVFVVEVEDVDSSGFRFRTDAKFARFSVGARNGTISINPTNAEVGQWTINLSVEDGDGAVTVVRINLTVHNVNDAPGIIYILQPKNGRTFEEGTSILMQGTCTDPDEVHGQNLTFTWLSNVTGELGRGSSISVSDLPAGRHRITLQVSDGEVTVSESVRIEVLAKPSGPNGGGNGGDGSPLVPNVSGGGLVALLLVMLLALAIALVYINRGKIRSRMEGRPSAEAMEMPSKDAPIAMVHGIPMPAEKGEDAAMAEGGGAGTDMMSVMTGRRRQRQPYEESIPVSPWSEEALRTPPAPTAPTAPARQGPPVAAPAPRRSQAGVPPTEAGWTPPPAPPQQQARQPPPLPPGAQAPPTPRQRPKPKVEESEWEEM